MLPYTTPTLFPVIVLLALATGAALGQYWRARWLRRHQTRLRREAKFILKEATRTGKACIADAELHAREMLRNEVREFEREQERMREELLERERLITRRLEVLHAQEIENDQVKRGNQEEVYKLAALRSSLNEQEKALLERIATCAELSQQEARHLLLTSMTESCQAELTQGRHTVIQQHETAAAEAARKLLLTVLNREALQTVSQSAGVLVPLPDSEMKRRIVGRDGRNVRAFEAITGVDILVDEFADQVWLSCHDPLRREVACRALNALIADGRIQPSRIEQFVEQAREELNATLRTRALQAAAEVIPAPLPEAVLEVIAALALRSTLSQNLLVHSLETAHFAGSIAAEMGLPQDLQQQARRAGFLHDLGKALSHRFHGPHALVGAEFLREHGEDPVICNAVAAHHQEVPDESILAPIIRIADVLSSARPGARREDRERFTKRLTQIESIACACEGVVRAYALNAGRELHVLVEARQVSDAGASVLAHDLARKIEREVKAGPEIKVIILRESRATSTVSWKGERPLEGKPDGNRP